MKNLNSSLIIPKVMKKMCHVSTTRLSIYNYARDLQKLRKNGKKIAWKPQ
jgi:hypothetical protein